MQMLENLWKYPDRPDLGLMNIFNSMVHDLDVLNNSSLPDLRRGSMVLIGSDYSGQHVTSIYESFAFVFADIQHCQKWGNMRHEIRRDILRDGRRISYKTLKDKKRLEALYDFLQGANDIPGLLVVILIHKGIESLFKASGRIEQTDPEIESLINWPPHVVEKLLRIIHFISLFLAGLSREGQDVLWITDEDEIAANEQRHRELTTSFGNVASQYLEHTLGNVRVATTKSDTGKRDVEDFVSIADLAAGSLCEALNAYARAGIRPTPNLILPPPSGLDKKALNMLNWFSDRRHTLKRLVFSIDPVVNSARLSVKQLIFQGSN
jgi:hypothetical protein